MPKRMRWHPKVSIREARVAWLAHVKDWPAEERHRFQLPFRSGLDGGWNWTTLYNKRAIASIDGKDYLLFVRELETGETKVVYAPFIVLPDFA